MMQRNKTDYVRQIFNSFGHGWVHYVSQ